MSKSWNALFVILAVVALFGLSIGMVLDRGSPVEARQGVWPTANVTYNIWATDGYMKLADGTTIYTYGFIGGRQGTQIKYVTTTAAGVQTLSPAVTVPALTGGKLVPGSAEAQFLGQAQVPGPVIYCEVGDIVRINFKNLGVSNPQAPNDPHTIHLHGIDGDAANDGVPETSVAGVPANSVLPGAGNMIVYMFYAEHAGTYMYHCHQEADIHVQMGMYGALVVYEKGDAAALNGGPGKGFGGTLHGWAYDKDYIMLLTEIDVRQHTSEQFALAPLVNRGGRTPIAIPGAIAFNPVDYKPQYWLWNGLSFPNTVHADFLGAQAPAFTFAQWLQAFPNYDPFVTGSVSANQTVLVRAINLGFQTQPMHVHGFHPKIIGSDQRAWPWAQPNGTNTPAGVGLEKNTVLIGSGETYELLFDFGTHNQPNDGTPANNRQFVSNYPLGTQTRYDPVTGAPKENTLTQFPAIPDPLMLPLPGINDYLPGPQVGGVVGLPKTDPWFGTSQFFPFHNHDDYKATNNGVYPGGQFILVRLDP